MKKDLDYKNKYPPRLFESGSSFMYGTNIDWVGRLVEEITKQTLKIILEKILLEIKNE